MTKRINAISPNENNKLERDDLIIKSSEQHHQDRIQPNLGANHVFKKRRRPGERALEEIKHYQHTTQLLIPESYFQKVVKDITKTINPTITFEYSALLALQAACEAVAIGTFEDGNLLCLHANRVTVMSKDIILSEILKG